MSKPAFKLPLNVRHRAFARAYIRCRCAVDAYIEAGFRGTRGSAYSSSARLLKDERIQAYIKKLETEVERNMAKTLPSKWAYVGNLRDNIAFASIEDFMDFSGPGLPQLKPANKIPKWALKAVSSFKATLDKDGITQHVEFKFSPKDPHLAALEDKYSIMPDNQKKPEKIDITSGGLPLVPTTVEGRAGVVRSIVGDLLERAAKVEEQIEGGTPQEDV